MSEEKNTEKQNLHSTAFNIIHLAFTEKEFKDESLIHIARQYLIRLMAEESK
jgi:hypothetical protein